ncbi:MAG: hypothetical protein ACTS4W_01785 [Candidatus Hodgkinia cicadicola]
MSETLNRRRPMEMVEGEAFHPPDCMGGIAIRWSAGEKMDYVAFATAEVDWRREPPGTAVGLDL